MKTSTIFIIILLMLYFSAFGQVQNTTKYDQQKITIGFDIQEFQKDYGLGLSIYTPTFWYNKFKVRAAWSAQWLDYIQPDQTSTWQLYQNFRLGLQGRTAIITEKVYTYGEGGLTILLPHKSFSSKSFVQGGYGCFGIEIYIHQGLCYYLEIGGIGTGAKADKALFKPIYSNGMMLGFGMRIGL